MIYDRNDTLVVYNQPAYDVMMIPRDVHDFDTLDFCRTLAISPEEFQARLKAMKASKSYSSYTPQTLITHLSAKDYGKLQEKLYRYPGFFIQKRILREYAYDDAYDEATDYEFSFFKLVIFSHCYSSDPGRGGRPGREIIGVRRRTPRRP